MLEIRDLHVKFHNRDREAVAGVSLTIHDGEILGLVGESGSGKSVTAMSVAGLLPRKSSCCGCTTPRAVRCCWMARSCSMPTALFCGKFRAGIWAWCSRSR